MAHNWTRTGTILAGVGVVATIIIGTVPNWDRIFPSERVEARIERVQWKMGSGRLGQGPYAIVKLQLSNKGSVPVTITHLSTAFALGSIESNAPRIDCDTTDFTWMGVPWDRLLRGKDYEEAVSIPIPPRDLVSEVVFFEPAAVLSDSDRKNRSQFKIFACLDVVAVDADIDRQEHRIPIGWLTFDDKSVIDFTGSNESKSKIVIFD